MTITSTLDQVKTSEIRRLLEAFVSLWNAKDAEQFGTIFTENAEYTDVVGQVATSRQAIIKQHHYPFAVVNKLAIFVVSDVYMRPLTDDLVMVTGKWRVERSTTPTGQLFPLRQGVIQIVCQYTEARRWQIRLVHNTDDQSVFPRQEQFINA